MFVDLYSRGLLVFDVRLGTLAVGPGSSSVAVEGPVCVLEGPFGGGRVVLLEEGVPSASLEFEARVEEAVPVLVGGPDLPSVISEEGPVGVGVPKTKGTGPFDPFTQAEARAATIGHDHVEVRILVRLIFRHFHQDRPYPDREVSGRAVCGEDSIEVALSDTKGFSPSEPTQPEEGVC